MKKYIFAICAILIVCLSFLGCKLYFDKQDGREVYKYIKDFWINDVYIQWREEEPYRLSEEEKNAFLLLVSEVDLGEKIQEEITHVNCEYTRFIIKRKIGDDIVFISDGRYFVINGEVYLLKNQSDDSMELFEEKLRDKHCLQKESSKELFENLDASNVEKVYLQFGGKYPHCLSAEEESKFWVFCEKLEVDSEIPDEEIYIGGGWTTFILQLKTGEFILLSVGHNLIMINNERYRPEKTTADELSSFQSELYKTYDLMNRTELSWFIYG